jgi:hypothetical protein
MVHADADLYIAPRFRFAFVVTNTLRRRAAGSCDLGLGFRRHFRAVPFSARLAAWLPFPSSGHYADDNAQAQSGVAERNHLTSPLTAA